MSVIFLGSLYVRQNDSPLRPLPFTFLLRCQQGECCYGYSGTHGRSYEQRFFSPIITHNSKWGLVAIINAQNRHLPFTFLFKLTVSSCDGSIKVEIMSFFARRQQRKIHSCLLFKRKSSSNDDLYRRLNTNSNVSENQNLDDNLREEINHESNLILLDHEHIKKSRALAGANAAAISKKRNKASTPEEMPIEGRTLNKPLISGEMLFAKKFKELGLLKEHRCKYIDGI